jgi:enoyl-CoA hydratase/carnithine racemase
MGDKPLVDAEFPAALNAAARPAKQAVVIIHGMGRAASHGHDKGIC